MGDRDGAVVGDEAFDGVGVGQVGLVELEAVGVADGGEVGAFTGRVVVVVEVVEADDAVPVGDQSLDEVGADEPGGAGDEDGGVLRVDGAIPRDRLEASGRVPTTGPVV